MGMVMAASVRADPPPGGKVDGNAVVFCQAKVIRHCGSGVELSAMPLSVIKGQSDHTESIL